MCNSIENSDNEAVRFDRFARVVFRQVYPSLAEQILNDYAIKEGICLDLGCGSGYLGIEVAKRSELTVIGVDIDSVAVRIARNNIKRANLAHRMTAEQGDVHQLRFEDESADLIISRGSFIFWRNISKAFREIYRVLKPGGVAFIGGGMGRTITPEQKAEIKLQLEKEGWLDRCRMKVTPVMMQETLEHLNIQNYRIMGDGPEDSGCQCGMWVEIRKATVAQRVLFHTADYAVTRR